MSKSRNTASKKADKNNITNNTSNYKYEPKVETPNPKATSNKVSDHPSK